MIPLRCQISEHILASASHTLLKREALLRSDTGTPFHPIVLEDERETEENQQTIYFKSNNTLVPLLYKAII